MKLLRTIQNRFGIVGELLSFMMANKRWWLLPMIVVLLLFGGIIILAQNSAIAAFVYTLF
jgi:hypothetical protein